MSAMVTAPTTTSLGELLSLVWRRKVIVLSITAVAIGAGFTALALVTPIYEAKTTLSISPGTDTDELLFLNSIDQIVPVYAEAATLSSTQDQAREAVGDLGEVSVATFEQTPILEIKVRHEDPEQAQAAAQAMAEALQDRVSGGDVGISSLTLTQLDTPAVPREPVFPQPTLTILVAAVLGVGLGIATAALRDTVTRTIQTPEDLADAAGVPVFGELPREAAITRLTSPEEFYEDDRLRYFSEAIRDLRTNLLFSRDSLRSILITSPEGASHGKTTVALALASTFARLGVKTLLVDADLRRGRVAEMLEIDRAPGLMEALAGKPVTDVIRKTDFENLDVLPCGEPVVDPGEIFESHFLQVLRSLEGIYEGIVIDAPPLVVVNDARIMARFVDATVMVASANMATRKQVRTAVDRLGLIGVELAASVLNRSKKRKTPGYQTYLEARESQPSPLK